MALTTLKSGFRVLGLSMVYQARVRLVIHTALVTLNSESLVLDFLVLSQSLLIRVRLVAPITFKSDPLVLGFLVLPQNTLTRVRLVALITLKSTHITAKLGKVTIGIFIFFYINASANKSTANATTQAARVYCESTPLVNVVV